MTQERNIGEHPPQEIITLGAGRFFKPLGYVAIFSYLLAVPLLAWVFSVDLDFGGRWMCEPYPVNAFGVFHDRSGTPICRIEVDKVLFFWTFFAATASFIPIFGLYLVRRLRSRFGRDVVAGKAMRYRLWRDFAIDTVLCVSVAAIVGRGWPMSFVLLPGLALAVYAYLFFRPCVR